MKETYKVEEVAPVTVRILQYMGNNNTHILALSGELGAGKTTLVQALAQSFGITTAVQSPTFTILKSYEVSHPKYTHFVHVDAYRIAHEEELLPIRFSDYLADEYFVCIEWPEQIPGALAHTPHTLAKITHKADEREIELYEKR